MWANEIKSYIEGAAECSGAQISIVDIGGTVGIWRRRSIWKPSGRCGWNGAIRMIAATST